MEPQNKTHKNIGIAVGVVVVVIILAVAIFAGRKPAQAPATEPTQSSPADTSAASQTPPADAESASIYKDGTYTATGSYMSPGGADQISVTLTLKNGIITDVNATPEPGDPTSAKYQAKFISGYKQYVVGKNIADVNLTKVSGSSLTPAGFDDALTQIKAEALS